MTEESLRDGASADVADTHDQNPLDHPDPLATSAKPISSYTICEIKIHHQKLELRHNCSITVVRATVDCLFRAAGDKGGQQDVSMVSTAGFAMAGPAGDGRIG